MDCPLPYWWSNTAGVTLANCDFKCAAGNEVLFTSAGDGRLADIAREQIMVNLKGDYIGISDAFNGAIQHFDFADGVNFGSFEVFHAAINKPKYNSWGIGQIGGRLSDGRLEGDTDDNEPGCGNLGSRQYDGALA